MNKVLDYCLNSHKVASFYFNKQDNLVHLTGFVYYFNDNELLIAHITPRGEYDGYILNKIENLYKIDYDGDYENKIQRLYELKGQKHKQIPCCEGILFSLLDFAHENQLLVSLELFNDKITGSLEEYNDFIHLCVVDDSGRECGKTIIAIDEVITFSCDTDYEQDLCLIIRQGDKKNTGDGSAC